MQFKREDQMRSSTHPISARLIVLALTVIGAIVVTATLKPIPQPLTYHQFADARQMFGIPRACDVLSNLPFVVVGIAGLVLSVGTNRRFLDSDVPAAYTTMFTGLLLTGFGSAYYHLSPDNYRLVWDRLPMTLVMAGFLSVLIMDRTKRRVPWILPLLVVLGIGSVLNWRWSEVHGHGDLRWYALFQALAILTGLLLLVMFRAQRSEGTGVLVIAISSNVTAKVFELLDKLIYHLGGIVSGHTLKHLSAGLGFVPLLFWLGVHSRKALNDGLEISAKLRRTNAMIHTNHERG
jgi:hypothetical protein